MADEIQVTVGLNVLKGEFRFNTNQIVKNYDLTGAHKTASTQDLTTTPEGLEIAADLGTPGWAYFANTSSVTIQVGSTISSTNYGFLSLEPGEICVCPVSNSNLAAWTDSGTGSLDFVIVER